MRANERALVALDAVFADPSGDVDCNAAQILTVWGTIYGSEAIPEYWRAPIGDKLDTYVRGMEVLSIKKLSARTAAVARALL